MLDLKWIRKHPDVFDEAMRLRGCTVSSEMLLQLGHKHRTLIQQMQELQSQKNHIAKSMSQAKSQGHGGEALIAQGTEIKKKLESLDSLTVQTQQDLHQILLGLPNVLDQSVPEGRSEGDNHLIHTWGIPRSFDFDIQSHDTLGRALGLMDFECAAKVSGTRFVYLKGALALLERALINYILDVHTQEFGYTQVSVPFLVRSDALIGTGQLPKFSEDLFQTTDGRWLIPTAEVPVTNLVREQILNARDLPQRYVCYSPCFRSEAGSAGRDTRGMIRQHQFHKVELVSITTPEGAPDEHIRVRHAAEFILQKLELLYRCMLLCTADTSSAMIKTYDLEVWIPSENIYREISSCSHAGDYQARRMNARFRASDPEHTKDNIHFVHTLNGSGGVIGRAMVAILENYQNADGSITIPTVLQPHMKGILRIESNK